MYRSITSLWTDPADINCRLKSLRTYYYKIMQLLNLSDFAVYCSFGFFVLYMASLIV